MLRVLHTADWHLGKRLGRFERLEEQRRALEALLQHADRERADIVLIAGDVFDSANPSAEAQALFYDVLHELARGGERPVVVIAGNHDSPERLEAASRWGHRLGILLVGSLSTPLPPAGTALGHARVRSSSPGLVELEHPRWAFPLRLLLLPYVSPYRLSGELNEPLPVWLHRFCHEALASQSQTSAPTVVLGHLYCRPSTGTALAEDEEEKSIALTSANPIPVEVFPESVHYVALGHLHRPVAIQSSYPPVLYSGSILPYSFNDPTQEKSVVLAELSPTGAFIQRLPLSGGYPLRRLVCTSVEHARQELARHQDAYVELSVICDHALAAEDYESLLNAHSRIVALIPLPRRTLEELHTTAPTLQSMDISELFIAFYRSRKGIDPEPALLELLQEVLRAHQQYTAT